MFGRNIVDRPAFVARMPDPLVDTKDISAIDIVASEFLELGWICLYEGTVPLPLNQCARVRQINAVPGSELHETSALDPQAAEDLRDDPVIAALRVNVLAAVKEA